MLQASREFESFDYMDDHNVVSVEHIRIGLVRRHWTEISNFTFFYLSIFIRGIDDGFLYVCSREIRLVDSTVHIL